MCCTLGNYRNDYGSKYRISYFAGLGNGSQQLAVGSRDSEIPPLEELNDSRQKTFYLDIIGGYRVLLKKQPLNRQIKVKTFFKKL